MATTQIAVTPNNVICEVIYRLYTNLLNRNYGVQCDILETDELLSVYHILNSTCPNKEEALECIDVDLYRNNFKCDREGPIVFECNVSASIITVPDCVSPQLSIL